MLVTDLQYDAELEYPRVSAQVVWEQSDRAPFSLFFETSPKFANDMSADPNALVLACHFAAWRTQEERLVVEGPVCPLLVKNLRATAAILRTWYPTSTPVPEIVSKGGFEARRPVGKSTVSMLSCGIDSLATLRWNKLHIDADHPDAITGVMVYVPKRSDATRKWAVEGTIGRWSAASHVAKDVGADAIPVLSNVWWLIGNGYFYDYAWHGALLASIAYLFGSRFRKVCIASATSEGNLQPWGTHPMLDPYYSCGHLQVWHDGMEMSRFEKVALIADWPAGLDSIRVCQNKTVGDVNCGRCEKCIRTQIALVALGKLATCSAFPNSDVTPDLLERLWTFGMLNGEYDLAWYPPLIQPLRDRGRDDVADCLADVLARYGAKGGISSETVSIW